MQESDVIFKFLAVYFFLLGTIIGSFLNVCIYRLPLGLSVFIPARSFCPSCRKQIKWYDNIPLFSFILLKARCRFCHRRISPRYFFIELLTGLLFLFLFLHYGLTFKYLWAITLASILVVVFFIDLEHMIIPAEVTYFGMVLGLLFSLKVELAVFPYLAEAGLPSLLHTIITDVHLINSITGLFIGWGFFYSIRTIGSWVFKKEAMGAGDVDLGAMLGAFLGAYYALLSFYIAIFLGAVLGILFLLLGRRRWGEGIPFGPYMAVGVFVIMFMFK